MNENFAIYETKVGLIRIGYKDNGVTFLKRVEEAEDYGMKTPLTEKVYEQLVEYFDGKRKDFDFSFSLNGTEFQQKVWSELRKIPYGQTRTYKEIAIMIGNEKASRAVGMANNKNPINIVVPCHRIVGSSGNLVGYAGGLEMKKFLLDLEEENK